MDKEFLARTAAIHAKEIAAEAGHDAIAIIYFARQLAWRDLEKMFKLTYRATVEVRSLRPDGLLYFNFGEYSCLESDPLSMGWNTIGSLNAIMSACEEEIHGSIFDDFLGFLETAGVRISK